MPTLISLLPQPRVSATSQFAALAPARWVWAKTTNRPNQFAVFAHTLPATNAPIRVRIGTSQAYELYLDGQFIGRGPVTASDNWRLFDQYHWTPETSERNVEVTIVALHETPPPAATWLVEAGVIASFQCEDWEIGTDENWRCLPLENWRASATKRNGALGFCEDYDARLAPDGWDEKSFAPDTNWENATETEPPNVEWQARYTPYLKRRFVAPQTFWAWRANEIGAANVGEISQLHDEEALELVAPPRAFDLGALNALLAGGANTFTFDLGAEHLGFYALKVSAPRGTVLEISGAELLQSDEAGARPAISRKGTIYSARLTAGENSTDFISWNWSGFRYLHVAVRGLNQNVRIERVGCVERKLDLPRPRPLAPTLQRELESDNELKQIFDLCARTLEVGVQEHLADCPTREQLQYWGDAVFVAQSLWRGWGENSYLRFFLDCFLHVPLRPDGQISCVFPGQTAQVLLDYSLIPLIGQRFWHENTGEFYEPAATLQKALELKKWVDARRDADNLVSFDFEALKAQKLINFIDHPGLGWHDFPHRGIERDGTSAPLNLFLLGFVQTAAQIAEALNDERAANLRAEAREIEAALRRRFYDGRVFHDIEPNGTGDAATSWQTNALAVYFGVLKGEEARRAMGAMLDGYDELCRCSPYFHFFFLPALRLAGMENEARALIKREWAPMLHGGATTAWEGFLGDEKDSLCHPWSTAPLQFLLESDLLARDTFTRSHE